MLNTARAVILSVSAMLPLLAQTVGSCPVFPSDHIWNTPVDNLPVHSKSSNYISKIGPGTGMKADFGSGLWDGGPIGIPYITVPGTQTKYPATFTYADESDKGPYAIPLNAPIEGGSNGSGDRHALSVDVNNCILYELYAAYPQSSSWRADSGAIFDLKSYALRPAGWTSADAAGLAVLPGLVRYEEVAAGEIRHALRFTVPQTQKAYVWPGRHYASNITDTNYPPMGQRFRLRESFDITPFPADVQVILRALKRYGMMLADNGSAWYLSGAPDERWNNDNLRRLSGVLGSDFEAVDVSSLMINKDSGQARQSGIQVSVSPATVSIPVNTEQQFTAAVTGTSGTGVNWSVNGVAGGSSATGTIDGTGRYKSPASAVNVTVEATSIMQSTARGQASVTVTGGTTTTKVTISPTMAVVSRNATKQFTATVTGNSDTRVTWRVNGIAGGNSSLGTISGTGLYKAPSSVPSTPTVKVSAVSVAAPTVGAAALVRIR